MTPDDHAARTQRLQDAARLQEVEGNPLSAEDLAMFAMFDRLGWSDEQCLAYIAAEAMKMSGSTAAE